MPPQNAAQRVGIELIHHHLSTDVTESELLSLIRRLNSSEDGIIVQLPLPRGLEITLNEIKPEKVTRISDIYIRFTRLQILDLIMFAIIIV